MNWSKWLRWLEILVAFLLPMIFVLFFNQVLDNDSWFVLAEGKEIVNNGVYYVDQLSMHEGLAITVQQYGFAAIFYLIFETFGAPGLYFGMLVMNFAICVLLYKICMLLSNKNVNLSLLIMMVADFLLTLGFVTTRAQMVSYVIFLALIYVLELYIKTDKVKYLGWIPFLSILQINLHASVWWMLVLVLGVYIVDAIKKPKLHLQGYRMKPLIIVGIIMILSGLINPYGIKMIAFIFTSYGNAGINNLVDEMKPFTPLRNVFAAFAYISIVITLLLYIFGKKKNIKVRYLLMFFGFLALGLNTIKGFSYLTLVMFVPMATVYKNARLEKAVEAKIGREALMLWTGVVVVAIFVVMCPMVVGGIADHPDRALVLAMDAIENDAGDRKKDSIKIYAGYNYGGYVEYRGYKPYLDPRAEVFLKKNNGKEDILDEWIDFRSGRVGEAEFLEKYKFDYILAVGEKNESLYKLDNKRYEEIFEDEENEVKVFKLK